MYDIPCPRSKVLQCGPGTDGGSETFSGYLGDQNSFPNHTKMSFAFPLALPLKCTVEFSSVHIMSDDVTLPRARGMCTCVFSRLKIVSV